MKLKSIFFPLAVVLSTVVIIWVDKPVWTAIKSDQKALQKNKEELNNLRTKKDNLFQAADNYDKLNGDQVVLIDHALPSTQEEVGLLAEINQKAKETGVIINNNSLAEENKKAQAKCPQPTDSSLMATDVLKMAAAGVLKEEGSGGCNVSLRGIKLSFEVLGDYPKVKEFFASLEKANRIMDIQTAEINRAETDEEGGASDLVSTKVDLVAYWQVENNQVDVFSLLGAQDPIMLSLLDNGKISQAIIDNFVGSRTNTVFEFSPSSEGAGKSNLFAPRGNK